MKNITQVSQTFTRLNPNTYVCLSENVFTKCANTIKIHPSKQV